MTIARQPAVIDELPPHCGGPSGFAVADVDPTQRSTPGRTITTPTGFGPCSQPLLLQEACGHLIIAGG